MVIACCERQLWTLAERLAQKATRILPVDGTCVLASALRARERSVVYALLSNHGGLLDSSGSAESSRETVLGAACSADASGRCGSEFALWFFGVIVDVRRADLAALSREVDAELRTPMHAACRYGHAHLVSSLMALGSPMNLTDAAGLLPEEYAARNGHAGVLAVMGQHWAPTRARFVIEAAAGGSAACLVHVFKIAREHVMGDVNAVDPSRQLAPLHAAALRGSVECIELLMRAGADMNLPACHGIVPRLFAALFGEPAALLALARVGAPAPDGYDCAARLGVIDTGCIGFNRLRCTMATATPKDDALLALPRFRSAVGTALLARACTWGSAHDARVLMWMGVDPTAPDPEGWRPLATAAYRGSGDCVVALLKAGCAAAVLETVTARACVCT